MNYQLGGAVVIAGLLLAGCGENTTSVNSENTTISENQTTAAPVDNRLKEPAKDEKCAFCNMKVYQKNNKLGAFTAQAIDDKGKNLFFDDAGCMLNYEREHNVTLEKFVRDYDSKEWIHLEDAAVVAGDIKTPMNYGFAYFAQKVDAQKFIDKHEGSKLVAVEDIDDKAHEKMKMKMNMQSEQMDDSTESHGH
ncbi:nitrous oxide reductase accessory protein NosL [Kurthia sp. Dielmo]|uniref:nitrous oxide reductase accessory protein NosL n=1 Tax=Kurthia sp. Dielmo TaxID=1033738 RepID=UPI00111CE283|nr:nitrous oxide reductase accessory protein NosL [Kurthia sp. Dielmo]